MVFISVVAAGARLLQLGNAVLDSLVVVVSVSVRGSIGGIGHISKQW